MARPSGRSIALSIGLATIAACGAQSASQPVVVVSACSGAGLEVARAYGADARLSAGFETTAGRMAHWEERIPMDGGPRIGASKFRSHPPVERVAVCYYDGAFENFGKRPGPAGPNVGPSAELKFERLLVYVGANGKAEFKAIGPAASIPIDDPAD